MTRQACKRHDGRAILGDAGRTCRTSASKSCWSAPATAAKGAAHGVQIALAISQSPARLRTTHGLEKPVKSASKGSCWSAPATAAKGAAHGGQIALAISQSPARLRTTHGLEKPVKSASKGSCWSAPAPANRGAAHGVFALVPFGGETDHDPSRFDPGAVHKPDADEQVSPPSRPSRVSESFTRSLPPSLFHC